MRVPQDLERFRELPMAVVYRSAADGGAKPKCVRLRNWNLFQNLQARCAITRAVHRDGTRRGSHTVGHVVRHGGSAVAEPVGNRTTSPELPTHLRGQSRSKPAAMWQVESQACT